MILSLLPRRELCSGTVQLATWTDRAYRCRFANRQPFGLAFRSITMPKMKTNKAAARRFKITGTGKILRKQAGKRHINEWMSPNVKRNLRGWTALSKDQK